MATKSLARTSSECNSSDYFEADDPDFLEALQCTVLPGDIPSPGPSQISDEADATQEAEAPPCTQPSLKRPFRAVEDPTESPSHDVNADSDTYAPSKFGGMGDYMRRKRAKLQIQNAQLSDGSPGSKLFEGLALYINGWTEPSIQDLRQLIIQHGGIFHAYLDKKALVTHIITCSLTPAKIRQFKRMKVVRPDWLVKSIEVGVLLPWKDFIFRPGERAEDSQGTNTAQTSLYDRFISGSRPLAPTSRSADETSLKDVSIGSHEIVRDPDIDDKSNDFDMQSSDAVEAPPCGQPSLKRTHNEIGSIPPPSTLHQVMSADATDHTTSAASDDSSDICTPQFGGSGEHMRRKRVKLQIENLQSEGAKEGPSTIFQGLAIYINGSTEPPVLDLQQLIVRHGGIYLSNKSVATHIIASSLTPAKMRELKNMKLVKPNWLVDSANANTLLPWANYMFRPGERAEDSQGTQIAHQPAFDGSTPLAWASAGRSDDRSSSPPLINNANVTDTVDIVDIDEELDKLGGTSSRTSESNKQTLLKPLSKVKEAMKPRPLYTTDPANAKDAAQVPHYAAHVSNPNAERAMANPEWRSAHTSIAPDFIDGFYKNSRLHHLSTWKAALKNLVMEAHERAENNVTPAILDEDDVVGKIPAESVCDEIGDEGVSMWGAELVVTSASKGKAKTKDGADEDRCIMHCDFDCFFVAAGLVSRPHLRGKPVVVCHSQGAQGGDASTSEIASSSYEARKFGVKNGMSLQQARKLCPTVITIPYEFERYKKFALIFYTILMSHADDLEAVSVDEALIDVTNSVARLRAEAGRRPPSGSLPTHPAKELAESIRTQVKKSTGCEVSIGIAHNILLARLATRHAKPAGSYHLVPAAVPDFLAPLDIDHLHGFGRSTRQKAADKLGATTLGELVKMSKSSFCDALGKGMGETLYKALRGIDDRKLQSDKPRKSVSCEINYGIRFENNDQAEKFVYQMAEEVSRRLNGVDMLGKSITVKIMKRDPAAPVEPPKFLGHGSCDLFNKQMPLAGPAGRATSDDKIIGEHAWRLLKSFNFDPKELRGIGIQIQKLESASAAANPQPGQGKLPFKRLESPTKAQQADSSHDDFRVVVHPPSQEADDITDIDTAIDEQPVAGPSRHPIDEQPVAGPSRHPTAFELPSFSQVDKDVFDALPDDLRQELEAEYKRRSTSPAPVPVLPPPKKLSPKIAAKGTNLKRIAQQLAPRNRPVMKSLRKNPLFTKRDGPSGVRISEAELKKLDIDPDVFTILPVDLQREQLIMARQIKIGGFSNVPGKRKVIKPFNRVTRSPSAAYRRRPPPQAIHLQPPFLKQPGKEKGEKLYFTETEDVQDVIESWVEAFKAYPPNQKDVDYFAKFLVQCADGERSTDVGIEKAVGVVKWWLVLLRRYWHVWERAPDDGDGSDGGGKEARIGKAWWRAFRDVKEKMDVVARKKFGGCLALN